MRLYAVEGGDYIVKRVRIHRRPRFAAIKRAAEIVDGFRSVAELAKQRVYFEPDQLAFAVKIQAAAQGCVIGARVEQELPGDGSVGERTPAAASFMLQVGGDVGQAVTEQVRCFEAAACRQHRT